jgi:uncharacterized protein YdbL (DUF1318 family)
MYKNLTIPFHLYHFSALFMLLAVLISAPVMAANPVLNSAKASGVVGERLDGYVGIIAKASPDVTKLVKTTNRARRAAYQAIAQKTGQSLQVVQKLAAKKAYSKTPAGYYIQDASGAWKKR